MASIFGFIRGIRFRLLFILFTVIVGLIMQGFVINNGNDAINRLNALGEKRIADDGLILSSLIDSRSEFKSSLLNQINLIHEELLFNPNVLAISNLTSEINHLEEDNAKIINLLQKREFTNYDLRLGERTFIDQFILGLDNETGSELASIIDKSNFNCGPGQCGNLGEFETASATNIDRLRFLSDLANQLIAQRSSIVENNFNITEELFGGPATDEESLIDQLVAIQNQFSVQLAVDNQTDSTYAYNVLSLVNNIFSSINLLSQKMIEAEHLFSVQDDRFDLRVKLRDFESLSEELDELLTTHTTIINGNMTALSNIVVGDEVQLTGNFSALLTSQYLTRLTDYNNNYSELYQNQVDLNIILQGNGNQALGDPLRQGLIELGDDFDQVFDFIFLKFQDEQEAFSEILNQARDTIQSKVNRLTAQFSIATISISALLVVFSIFRIIRSLNKLESNLSKVADGDLTIEQFKKYRSDELGAIESGFDVMVKDLKGILSTIQNTTQRIAGIAEELAAGSEEASASVSEVSNTVREFSAGASEQNLMLNRVNQKLLDHIAAVEEASSRIGETSDFVLNVAKRTNILGLNASIEAAKAGRFGLGFGVVAEEVRNLSDDTKSSALQIADFIRSIESNIKETVEQIQREVEITKDVAENTAAGSEEANAATSEQVIMLSEISQTSNELSQLANELQEIALRFTLDIDQPEKQNGK